MWRGENLDSVVVLRREHGRAWEVGRQGQQNWPWALGITVWKDSPGRAPFPQHSLGQPGPEGRERKRGQLGGPPQQYLGARYLAGMR